MQTDNRQRALALIRRMPLSGLATLSGGAPHVTAVFAVVDDAFTIHFATREDTRKWRNILENPAVAMVFTNEATQETLQIKGVASREHDVLAEGKAIKDLIAMTFRHAEWILPIDKLAGEGGYVIARVDPREAIYSSYSNVSPLREELHF